MNKKHKQKGNDIKETFAKHDYYAFVLVVSLLALLIISVFYMTIGHYQRSRDDYQESIVNEADILKNKIVTELDICQSQLRLLSDYLSKSITPGQLDQSTGSSSDRVIEKLRQPFSDIGEVILNENDYLTAGYLISNDMLIRKSLTDDLDINTIDSYLAGMNDNYFEKVLAEERTLFSRSPFIPEATEKEHISLYSFVLVPASPEQKAIAGLLRFDVDIDRLVSDIIDRYVSPDLDVMINANGMVLHPGQRSEDINEDLYTPSTTKLFYVLDQSWELTISPRERIHLFTLFSTFTFVVWVVIIILALIFTIKVYKFAIRDLTAQKEEKERALENERRFRTLFEKIPELPVFGYDKQRKVIFWNEASEQLYGYKKEEALGRRIEELIIAPESREQFVKKFEKSELSGKQMPEEETRHSDKNGNLIDILSIYYKIDNLPGDTEYYTFVLEISSYKEAAARLKSEKEMMLGLFDRICEIIYVADTETGDILFTNSFVEEHICEDLANNKCFRALSDKKDPFISSDKKPDLPPDGRPVRWNYHDNGTDCHYMISDCLIDWKDGKKAKFTIMMDITEFKKVESSLTDKKEELYSILESIGEGFIATDTEGKITFINKVASELTGWAWRDAKNKMIDEVFVLIDDKTNEPLKQSVLQALETDTAFGIISNPTILAKDGSKRVIEVSGAPILNDEETILGDVILFRDITNKKRMEEHLIKKQKLESLGTLAAGIAYDFNNLLSSLFGYIEMAMVFNHSKEKVSQYLSRALGIYEKSTGLTDQLISFSRRSIPEKKIISMEEVLEETAQFALSGSKCHYELNCPQNLWLCSVDRNQIQQVINNLLINSVQAMPDGGKITISAENVPSSSAPVWTGKTSNYVKLSVSDEGMGIPDECLNKIFDPFYTTKHQGSGLGLAIAYSIIDKHDGTIDVTSIPEERTTFEIYLPSAGTANGNNSIEELTEEYSGKILIMDDDPMISDTVKETLEDLGYNVIVSSNGSKALLIYEEEHLKGEPFDLLILDLTVPGELGGLETLQILHQKYPDITALATSGYLDNPVLADPEKYGFFDKIEKPYHIDDFIALIHKAVTESFSSSDPKKA